MEIGEFLFFSAPQYIRAESRLDITYSLIKDGVRETKEAHTWIFGVAEIRGMLSAVGLETEGIHASASKEAFRLGSGG